jgi:hypothetical protein
MLSKLIFLGFSLLFLNQLTLHDQERTNRFNKEKDLLLAHFDCKTDVDDLHSMAALATLHELKAFSDINYHVVAGAYGVQKGLYVPPNDLCKIAFGNNWSDAHEDFEKAQKDVLKIARKTLTNGGDIWIAEGGQSDFSAALVRKIQTSDASIKTKERIHLIQHADWNEKVTDSLDLEFVRIHTDYNKIPDGNTIGNGTPGFRSEEIVEWRKKVSNKKLIEVWKMAIAAGNKYNGSEGRYNNEAVEKGGLDFSDLSETCWILGLEGLKDAEAFFDYCKEPR